MVAAESEFLVVCSVFGGETGGFEFTFVAQTLSRKDDLDKGASAEAFPFSESPTVAEARHSLMRPVCGRRGSASEIGMS